MKLGVVSDIHCNIAGLRRALALMGPIDRLLCLGDSIFDYRFSNEVVALLKETGAYVIHGNHEETFFGSAGVRARAGASIDHSLMQWLSDQPLRRDLVVDDRKIIMVHSTPWEPRGAYVTPGHPALMRYGDVDADIVLFGHTHMQIVRTINDVLVVNPGSAGDARDHSNGRLLSAAVIDTRAIDARIIDFPDPAGV